MAIKSSDQISIVDLTDGYSVMLTNDSFTFAGSTSAAVAGSTTTTVIAMCGGTLVAASVDNSAIVAPSGVTTSVDTDPTQPTITISVSSSVTTGGTVDIPVSIDNGSITIHKMFTFQISFRGQTGYSAQWYSGTGITGTSTTATSFSGSGVSNAQVGDMYLGRGCGCICQVGVCRKYQGTDRRRGPRSYLVHRYGYHRDKYDADGFL